MSRDDFLTIPSSIAAVSMGTSPEPPVLRGDPAARQATRKNAEGSSQTSVQLRRVHRPAGSPAVGALDVDVPGPEALHRVTVDAQHGTAQPAGSLRAQERNHRGCVDGVEAIPPL